MESIVSKHHEQLKRSLLAEKVTEKYFTTDIHDYTYATGLDEYLKLSNDERPDVIKAILDEVKSILKQKKNTTILRICSLGCGDGLLDKNIIEKVHLNYPYLHIEYVGIELNKISYKEAKKNLSTTEQLTIKIHHQDIMRYIPDEPFDLIMAIHSFYHLESCLDGIQQTRKMLNSQGTFFLSLSREGPLNEPLRTIWKKWKEPTFSLRLIEMLKKAEILFSIKGSHSNSIDISEAIGDNFTKKEHMCLLSFLTSAPMEMYSKSTQQSCINFFREEAEGKPGKYLIPYVVDYIVINEKSDN